ncbi:hypothetical protein TNCV_4474391 [Trichonephila clavipes]|nr:hypothetical protein TNCV_4474391 [Trichonephila clavipes]
MMKSEKEHARHCLLFEFDKKSTAAGACCIACKFYGADAMYESTCRLWFATLGKKETNCRDQVRSLRPSHVGEYNTDQAIRNNPDPIVQELVDTFNAHRTKVERRLVLINSLCSENCHPRLFFTRNRQNFTSVGFITYWKDGKRSQIVIGIMHNHSLIKICPLPELGGEAPLRLKLGTLLLRRIGGGGGEGGNKRAGFMSFRSDGAEGKRPSFYFRGVYVTDDLIRARFPTKDEKSRMSVTNPSVMFIQVHSPA